MTLSDKTDCAFPDWDEAVPGLTGRVGGDEVRLVYSDPEKEYLALRQAAGHYDLDACGRIRVRGHGAQTFVQRVLTRDVQYLLPEACVMGLMLDQGGLIHDIVTIFLLDDGSFQIQTAIGSGSVSVSRLEALSGPDIDVSLDDSQRAVAIEGPTTWSVLEKLDLEQVIDMPFQGVRSAEYGGSPVRVARTGMTGEFGVEIIGDHGTIASMLEHLETLCPRVGLLALESAMLEVRHPQLLWECVETDVVEAGLQWLVDSQKPDFMGRDAALAATPRSRSRVGFSMPGSRAALPGATVVARDGVVGEIIWSRYSPGRGAVVGVVALAREICVPGLVLVVEDPRLGRQPIETLSCPMVIPGSWAVVAAERARETAADGSSSGDRG
jgi:aminomethyltransferase